MRASASAHFSQCVYVFVLFCILDLFVYSSFLNEQSKRIQRMNNTHTECVVHTQWEAIKRAGCDVRVAYTISKFSATISVVAVVMSITPLIIIFTINFDRIMVEQQ